VIDPIDAIVFHKRVCEQRYSVCITISIEASLFAEMSENVVGR
jgi:hypothetical protein